MSAGQALPKAGLLKIAFTVAPALSWWQVFAFLAAEGVALESCPEADLAGLALPGGRAVSAGQALPKAGLLKIASTVATVLSWW